MVFILIYVKIVTALPGLPYLLMVMTRVITSGDMLCYSLPQC